MISTNGWFVDQDCAARLASLAVRHVRVSIDGSNAKTHDAIRGVPGSFDRAVNAVRYLKAAGVPIVGIAPTLMQRNVDEAPSIIDMALSLGATEIQLGQVCKVGRGEQLDELSVDQIKDLRQMIARKIRQLGAQIRISGSEGIWEAKPFRSRVLDGDTFPSIMGCGAGRTCMAIGPNGAVRACLLCRRPFGDLSKSSFDDLWHLHPSLELLTFRQVKDGCNGCHYVTVCSGPCPMERGTLPAERKFFIERQKEEERGGGKENDSASSSLC
jgi:radical SAM protein with 4Fe4S-binding SPASM domain